MSRSDESTTGEQIWTPGEALVAAKVTLEQALLFGVMNRAFSASSGTDSYGFENIVGVGISEKLVDGRPTGGIGVTVYVVAKAPRSRIAPDALVPDEVNGVPTDVVATGKFYAASYVGRYRPVPAGVSIGRAQPGSGAGTVGCLVKRNNKLFILSNNHVLANENNASVGDLIIQPALGDGGTAPTDVVARLSEWVDVRFGGERNHLDCAIAEVRSSDVTKDIHGLPFASISPNSISCSVVTTAEKVGRTTEYTRGSISDCNFTGRIAYDTGPAIFEDQIIIQSTGSPFADNGDSGSLVMYPVHPSGTTKRPVGLLFAVNSSGNYAIANPIDDVLRALNVSLAY